MFTGKHLHTIDDNNRLAIPSSIRKCVDAEKEGKGFYITPGLDKCLALYPPLHFEEIAKKLTEPMFTNKKARNFQRLFFSFFRICSVLCAFPTALHPTCGKLLLPYRFLFYFVLCRNVSQLYITLDT